MNNIIPFLMANWPLSLSALVLIIIIFGMEYRSRSMGVSLITPHKAAMVMNKKSCQIIDIRSKEAFQKSHINRAKNFSPEQLKTETSLNKYKKDPIIVVCDNGLASKKAGAALKSQGFEQIYAIEGGLAQWRKDSYPLTNAETKNG
ncbi:MAG: rhodanese-like domain-containing protein [Gammaproteobacteria bacterium]|nr:rhodanese-like domain-containing protein [Gammaproteobacteria bacterium]